MCIYKYSHDVTSAENRIQKAWGRLHGDVTTAPLRIYLTLLFGPLYLYSKL